MRHQEWAGTAAKAAELTWTSVLRSGSGTASSSPGWPCRIRHNGRIQRKRHMIYSFHCVAATLKAGLYRVFPPTESTSQPSSRCDTVQSAKSAGNTKSLFSLVTLLSFSLVLLSGCAAQREIRNLREVPVPITPPLNTEGVVFAADGAGDFRISSSHLRKVVYEDCLPIHVIPFVWSHGYAKIVKDQTDQCHIRCQGERLAQEVLAYRQEHPDLPLTLFGHSAGCNVVLAAMENLPPGVVDRVFLLSAAVSTCYDLRPALKVVNKGIYVYHSKHDCLYLSIAMRLLGRTTKDLRQGRRQGRLPRVRAGPGGHGPVHEALPARLVARRRRLRQSRQPLRQLPT